MDHILYKKLVQLDNPEPQNLRLQIAKKEAVLKKFTALNEKYLEVLKASVEVNREILEGNKVDLEYKVKDLEI